MSYHWNHVAFKLKLHQGKTWWIGAQPWRNILIMKMQIYDQSAYSVSTFDLEKFYQLIKMMWYAFIFELSSTISKLETRQHYKKFVKHYKLISQVLLTVSGYL